MALNLALESSRAEETRVALENSRLKANIEVKIHALPVYTYIAGI